MIKDIFKGSRQIKITLLVNLVISWVILNKFINKVRSSFFYVIYAFFEYQLYGARMNKFVILCPINENHAHNFISFSDANV